MVIFHGFSWYVDGFMMISMVIRETWCLHMVGPCRQPITMTGEGFIFAGLISTVYRPKNMVNMVILEMASELGSTDYFDTFFGVGDEILVYQLLETNTDHH